MYDNIKVKQLEEYLSEQSITGFINNLGYYSDTNKYTCIYHDDLYPSMFINEEDGIFYCFSCQRGGGLGKMIFFYYQKEYGIKHYYEGLELFLQLHQEVRQELGFSTLKSSRNKIKVESLDEILSSMDYLISTERILEDKTIELKPKKLSESFEEILNFCIKIQNKIVDGEHD